MKNRLQIPPVNQVLLLITCILFLSVIYIIDEIPGSLFAIFIDSIPYGDKISHIGFYGFLALAFNHALKLQPIRVLNQSALLGSTLIILLSSGEELSQYFIPSRTVDGLDLICSYIGIWLAELLILHYERLTGYYQPKASMNTAS